MEHGYTYEYKKWCNDNGHAYDSRASQGEFIRTEHRDLMVKHQVVYDQAEDGDNICVTCPHCDNWESQSVDQQRHHLGLFVILEWRPDEEGKNEFSDMRCAMCEAVFELEWIYNPTGVDEYFLFGELAAKTYDDEGVDAVAELLNHGEEHYLLKYNGKEQSGASLLAAYDGWNGFTTISREDYEQLCETDNNK